MAEKNKIENSSLAHRIILEPWITEKATQVAELNKYVFKVGIDASKKQVREAIENLYKTEVVAVNVINIPKKKRVRGRTTGWKSGFRKAVVTLKEGSSIEFFEGK